MADESRVLVPRVRCHRPRYRQRSEASLILLLSVLLAIATGIGFLWQLTRPFRADCDHDESRVLVPRVRCHRPRYRQRSEASLILLLSVLLAIATGIGFLWQLTRHSAPTVITVAADE